MKILLIGDSITDMDRNRTTDFAFDSYGFAYPFFIAGELESEFPAKYQIYNRGISGNRIVDLYSRIKIDCWNLQPDVISVLIGVNDVWHEIGLKNGVEIDRYERIYRMFIEDTKKVLPNVKFMILEPFVLNGTATCDNYDEFLKVKDYAKVARKIAEDENCIFVPLQQRFDELAEKFGGENWLYDGVHPSVAGAKIIADEWLKAFKKLCD